MQLTDVFNSGNVRGLNRAKIHNGNTIYHRFHTLGFYFSDYKSAESHVALRGEEITAFMIYVKLSMDKHKK